VAACGARAGARADAAHWCAYEHRRAAEVPEVRAKLLLQGLYPRKVCGAEFGALMRTQSDYYGGIIRASSIKAE
jgi:hypothetical protein